MKKLTLFLLLLSLTNPLHAKSEKHFLIAPLCLLENVRTPYKIIHQNASLALISTNNIDSFIAAKHLPREKPCGGFFNVSNEWLAAKKQPAKFLARYQMQQTTSLAAVHYSIQYPEQVKQLLNQFNPQQLWDDLIAFTEPHEFPDRFQNSVTGAKAAACLQEKIQLMAEENHRDDVTIFTVKSGFMQDSVVVKIGNPNTPGIVIGAHMDTYRALRNSVKPGADDDGSGCMTVLSIARTLLQSGMQFKKPIYLVWYAAEEFGLIGSQSVVRDFNNKKIPVAAVLQFDMTGYAYHNEDTMWLVRDYVNPELTDYLATLITTYIKPDVKDPVKSTACGYPCSDHASWRTVPAAFPFEAEFSHDNPNVHKKTDTIGLLSLTHMTDYAKLGLAFAVELAEPV